MAPTSELLSLPTAQPKTLTMEEIRQMKVRSIKTRLARAHGYSAEELAKMLDKKELIHALAFEEHKIREKEMDALKRYLLIRGVILAIIAVIVVMAWPLWTHLYEVAHVNLVVYLDKKRHEASKCVELRSTQGIIGVLLMGIVDLLQLWLTLSVLLSWFTSSRYFFPTPNMSVKPAQFMGEQVSKGPLAKYGLNIGPMAIGWGFRFVQGRLEKFTGAAMSKAYQQQKKEARDWESPEDRAARKAAKKAAKKQAREDAENQRREAERAEFKRRKDAAEQATSALFPTASSRPRQEEEKNAATMENVRERILPPASKYEQEFEEQVQSLDIDDLD